MGATTYFSSVSPKEQITLCAEVRPSLGIRPKDQVAVEVEGDTVGIGKVRSWLLAHFQRAPALPRPLGWHEFTRIAAE